MNTFVAPKSWTSNEVRARQHRRLPNEFYPTPPEATRALLSVETFHGSIWEPACGDGGIAKVLEDHGHAVVSTDLHAYGVGTSGVDFLREIQPRARHIVTNPPYGRGLADRFVLNALKLTRSTGGKVAMLLDLSSLCHPVRTAFWKANPPARIYALDDIICWPKNVPLPDTRLFTRRYCWVIWEHGYNGNPTFDWLSAAEFR
jgi:hypothetical protein